MSDLGTRLREYVDGAAPPITLDEVTTHEIVLAPERSARRRWLAVAAVLVLVAAAALYATRPESDPKVVTGTTVPESIGWLTPFGPEQPMPDVPAGWKIVDYEAVRFAVPRAWPVVHACWGPVSSTDVVVVPEWQGWVDNCPNVPQPPRVRLGMGGAARGLAGPVDRYDFDADGPVGRQIRATLTDSGARRALQDGPVADTTGWRTLIFKDVALRVPPAWGVIDTRAGDAVPDAPDDCLLQLFPQDREPVAFVSEQPVWQCPRRDGPGIPLSPGDGVWLRSAGGDSEEATSTSGRIGGLDVVVADLDSIDFDPALDLIASTGEHWVSVSIGVGLDASTARAILRSLHRA